MVHLLILDTTYGIGIFIVLNQTYKMYYGTGRGVSVSMKWDKYIDKIFGVGAGGLGIFVNHVWGGLDTMFIGLLGFMVLDFVAGVLCGGKGEGIDSRVAYAGITKKKMMILIMVAAAVIVDNVVGTNGVARSATIFWYISMEGFSLIENAGKLGFPIPPKLKKMFTQLKESGDEEDED